MLKQNVGVTGNFVMQGAWVEPTWTFDCDFKYDSKATPTAKDYANWAYYGTGSYIKEYFQGMKEAADAYQHYRDNSGTDFFVDLTKAYNEDAT